jgi:hypothetical protein
LASRIAAGRQPSRAIVSGAKVDPCPLALNID